MLRHFQNKLLKLIPISILRKYYNRNFHDLDTDSRKEKQLLIDVSVLSKEDAKTGIQRVVRNTYLQLLIASPHGYKICPIAATKKHEYAYLPLNFLDVGFQNHFINSSENSVKVMRGDLFLGLDLSAHIIPNRLSELLSWKRQGVRFVFYIYDLLPVLQPSWFNSTTTKNFKLWLRAIVILADEIICISKTVKAEYIDWTNRQYGHAINPAPCSVIPLGYNISDHLDIVQENKSDPLFLLKQKGGKKQILMVGTLEPRKGHEEILNAFEKLWATDLQANLIIVGKKGWKMDLFIQRLQVHPEAGKRLHWLEGLSDQVLLRLYQNVDGLIMASKGEGFGLPLIEAAYFGKPALVRDIPIFREIAIGNVTFFQNSTSVKFLGVLTTWIQSLIISPNPINLEPGRFTTWQESSRQLVSLLQSKPVKQ